MPIPARDRVARRAHDDLAAVETDLAGVGAVEAVEHVHQRGLAGTVAAEEPVHLAGADGEVDAVEGHHRSERLADRGHLEQGVPGGRSAGHPHRPHVVVRHGCACRPVT